MARIVNPEIFFVFALRGPVTIQSPLYWEDKHKGSDKGAQWLRQCDGNRSQSRFHKLTHTFCNSLLCCSLLPLRPSTSRPSALGSVSVVVVQVPTKKEPLIKWLTLVGTQSKAIKRVRFGIAGVEQNRVVKWFNFSCYAELLYLPGECTVHTLVNVILIAQPVSLSRSVLAPLLHSRCIKIIAFYCLWQQAI